MSLAMDNVELYNYLLSHGAKEDIYTEMFEGKTVLVSMAITERNDLNQYTTCSRTLLHMAANSDNTELVLMLITDSRIIC